MSTPASRSRGDSVRVNDSGTPACKSLSELYVNVPRRFTVWSCDDVSRRTSVPSFSRCLLLPLNHDIVLLAMRLAVRCVVFSI